jgi:hypothetical protein
MSDINLASNLAAELISIDDAIIKASKEFDEVKDRLLILGKDLQLARAKLGQLCGRNIRRRAIRAGTETLVIQWVENDGSKPDQSIVARFNGNGEFVKECRPTPTEYRTTPT